MVMEINRNSLVFSPQVLGSNMQLNNFQLTVQVMVIDYLQTACNVSYVVRCDWGGSRKFSNGGITAQVVPLPPQKGKWKPARNDLLVKNVQPNGGSQLDPPLIY